MCKRIFPALCLLLCLALTGCSAFRPPDPLSFLQFPYRAEGELTVGESTCRVRITMNAPTDGFIEWLTPASLCGMRVGVTPEGVTWTYGEHTVVLPEDSAACRAVLEVIRGFGLPGKGAAVMEKSGFVCEGIHYIQYTAGEFPNEIWGQCFRFVTELTVREHRNGG